MRRRRDGSCDAWSSYSPLIVETNPEHEELKEIARGCITRFHGHHYLGFAATPRVKPLLYVYRVLLTGIHLMRTSAIEAKSQRPEEL